MEILKHVEIGNDKKKGSKKTNHQSYKQSLLKQEDCASYFMY